MNSFSRFWNWLRGKPSSSQGPTTDELPVLNSRPSYPLDSEDRSMRTLSVSRQGRSLPPQPTPVRSAPDRGISYPSSARRSAVAPATPSSRSTSNDSPDLVTTAVLLSTLTSSDTSSSSYSSSSYSDSCSSSSYDSGSSSSSCDSSSW